MENAAHHLDLRAADPSDPVDVIKARTLYARIFHQWIQEYRKKNGFLLSPYDTFLSSMKK